MDWLTSIACKSKNVIKMYQNELACFAENLNVDIKTVISTFNTTSISETHLENSTVNANNAIESYNQLEILIQVLQDYFFKEEIIQEPLTKIVEQILENPNKFQGDLNNLLLNNRNDFTNFIIFQTEFQKDQRLINKFIQNCPQIYNGILKSQNPTEDIKNKIILKFLYIVIYEYTQYLQSLEEQKQSLDMNLISIDQNQIITQNIQEQEQQNAEINQNQYQVDELKEQAEVPIEYKNQDFYENITLSSVSSVIDVDGSSKLSNDSSEWVVEDVSL